MTGMRKRTTRTNTAIESKQEKNGQNNRFRKPNQRN